MIALQKKGAILIDVREEPQYNNVRINQSRSPPFSPSSLAARETPFRSARTAPRGKRYILASQHQHMLAGALFSFLFVARSCSETLVEFIES